MQYKFFSEAAKLRRIKRSAREINVCIYYINYSETSISFNRKFQHLGFVFIHN